GALGFSSRYATPVIAPDPVADEDGFVEVLARLGAGFERLVPVFATHDEHMNSIVRRRAELSPLYRIPSPPWETLERIQDKAHQIDEALAIGVPVPETRYPRSAADAVAAAREIGFPVLMKPADNIQFKRSDRRQAFRCDTGAAV